MGLLIIPVTVTILVTVFALPSRPARPTRRVVGRTYNG